MGFGTWGLATGVLTNPLTGWGNDSSAVKESKEISGQSTGTAALSAEKTSVENLIGTVNSDVVRVAQNPSDAHSEAQLAADLASLHNVERQFFTDAGNTEEAAKFQHDASFTEEGSTDAILSKAHAKNDHASDYTYNLSQDSGGNFLQSATLQGQSAQNLTHSDLSTSAVSTTSG